ncbi:MAG: hypothetical protein Q8M76_12420, partial [Spirochaetaceae bacterium]|nr:hypothetical protein [Spirochaetaceae bacterium]
LPPLPEVSRNAPPNMLICRAGGAGAGEHVYALAAGQYPCWESVNAAAKYAKFAYSNLFGFCVSQGSYDLPKLGCDSMLALSEGDGYWRERRSTSDRYSCADYVRSTWAPWRDVRITTWLLPFGRWHLRVHAIDSARTLLTAEGGFSLPDQNSLEPAPRPELRREAGALSASFPWAFGAIVDLSPGAVRREAELHKPEPNLNLLYPKVLVPMLSGRIAAGKNILACTVVGGAPGPGAMFAERPSFAYDPVSGLGVASLGAAATGHGDRRVELDIGPGYGARP